MRQHEKNRGKGKKIRLKKEIILYALARTGEVTLEKLFNLVMNTGEFLNAMAADSKRQSMRALMGGVMHPRYHESHIDLVSKAALAMMISRLSKEGLVSKEGRKICITRKGKQKFFEKQTEPLKKLPDGKHVLVIFDIPESPRGRRNREWLRKELVDMGFEMVQKSVWKGDVILPKSFIKDIYELKLADFVHIFEITKYGTLN